MNSTKWGLGAALVLIVLAAPRTVRATSITYSFSGTLTNNAGTVNGTFTLDLTAAAITAFNFTTPAGTISASGGWTPGFFPITPALSPNTDFLSIGFTKPSLLCPFGSCTLNLIFQADLATFAAGGSLFTPLVQINSGSTTQSLFYFPPGGVAYFASGQASPVPVPEPASLILLGTGLLGVVGRVLRRNQHG